MDKQKKIVLKLGGSVLGDSRNVAKIPALVRCYETPVLVVSALGGVTKQLAEFVGNVRGGKSGNSVEHLVNYLREIHFDRIGDVLPSPSRRLAFREELDLKLAALKDLLRGILFLGEVPDSVLARVLAFGERLSALSISHLLSGSGIQSSVVTPEELNLATDRCFLNATIDLSRSEPVVRKVLSGHFTAVIPGFYGISPEGRVTLLGQGGSDYSAAAIAACIRSSSLDVFKDVSGYLSADPVFVKNVRPIPLLSYREAAELSYFGARILHPRTMEPVSRHGIPIRLFSFPISDVTVPATVIGTQSQVNDTVVKSVAFSDDFSIVEVRGDGVGMVPGLLAKVTGALSRAGINIKSVITAQTAINLLLEQGDAKQAATEVERLGIHTVKSVGIRKDAGVVAVVGEGIRTRPGIASQMFGALAAVGINVRMIAFGASPVAAYFVVDRKDRAESVAAIHNAFFSPVVTI